MVDFFAWLFDRMTPWSPWLLALISICFNLWQFRRVRGTRIKTTVEVKPQGHCRLLNVFVENQGTELNSLHAILIYPGADGQPIRFSMPYIAEDAVLKAFKYGYSCGFYVINDDPSADLEILTRAATKDLCIEIRSGARIIAVLSALKWRQQLDEFAKRNPNLPPKPEPVKQTLSSWTAGIPKRW